MSTPSPLPDARVDRAEHLERSGQALQAERLYLQILETDPGHPVAARRAAHLALRRQDPERAIALLELARAESPMDADLTLDQALIEHAIGRRHEARRLLESAVATQPDCFTAWLLLGKLHQDAGHRAGVLHAWFEAVTRAQRAGHWRGPESTPAQLLPVVTDAIATVRNGRAELFRASYEHVRLEHGSQALRRVDHALAGYLGEFDPTPADPRQRPKFLHFPGLPEGPFHDPSLQPFAGALTAAFPAIRDEALQLMRARHRLEDFVELGPNGRMSDFVGGEGENPAWEAFFFYRHGERYDDNHALCPRTSAVLESMELCRIDEQSPEICFSWLAPGSHILPHHGVTNVRLVMHLALVVPPDCALQIPGCAPYEWREGELMMFDDTYEHEAWNRSDGVRIVLLMDCWNPHLSAVEKQACRRLIETVSRLRLATSPRRPRPAATEQA
jgi:aspartate beta-hydroxylase